jgi:SNF2 family DNA or RNA helicase
MSLGDYITKSAEKGAKPTRKRVPSMKEWFKPYPHQAEAVDRLFANKGKLILAHEMGTGKTVTSIYGFEKMRNEGKARKALVVVPSGLRDNFAKNGVEKFTNSTWQVIGSIAERVKKAGFIRPGEEGDKQYTIVSYAMFRRDPIGYMKRSGADTLILDEFHKTRNERATTFKAVAVARSLATNFMGLTASLINNDPSELATLLTLSEGKRGLSPKQFKRRYTQTVGFTKGFSNSRKKLIGMKNIEELSELTGTKIDYVQTKDLKGKTMPRKDISTVRVPMSDEQYRLYQLALNKLGPIKKYITKQDPNITVKDAKQLFGQISQARQLANSLETGRKDLTLAQSAKRTPKVNRLLSDAENHLKERPDHKVVLYSNLIRGGVDVLSAGLKERGIPHAVFVGKGTKVGGNKVTGISRQAGVEDYKSGRKRVIVLSGAGAEGLDLKNSTAFYSLDGHFNPQRVLQAEGRARRLGGQQHRPLEERAVSVKRYQSTVPEKARPGFFGKLIGRKTPQTTDQWMDNVARRKFQQQQQFYKAYKQKKHLYKYVDEHGKTRYVYAKRQQQPKKAPGFFSRFFSGNNAPKVSPNPAPQPASF